MIKDLKIGASGCPHHTPRGAPSTGAIWAEQSVPVEDETSAPLNENGNREYTGGEPVAEAHRKGERWPGLSPAKRGAALGMTDAPSL